jgi:hypothetical protein
MPAPALTECGVKVANVVSFSPSAFVTQVSSLKYSQPKIFPQPCISLSDRAWSGSCNVQFNKLLLAGRWRGLSFNNSRIHTSMKQRYLQTLRNEELSHHYYPTFWGKFESLAEFWWLMSAMTYCSISPLRPMPILKFVQLCTLGLSRTLPLCFGAATGRKASNTKTVIFFTNYQDITLDICVVGKSYEDAGLWQ